MAAVDDLDPDANPWHWIAVELRIWRRIHRMTGAQLGALLGLTKSQVSNLEAGRSKLKLEHARILDRHWFTCGHFERLFKYASSEHNPNWFNTYTKYERVARRIEVYYGLMVPGLLQTPAYSRALLEAGEDEADLEYYLQLRLDRQKILYGEDPPQLRVLLKQSLLEDPVGGPAVMRAQLAHLREVSTRPNIHIRVLPRSQGAHVALDGSFMLIQGQRGDCAYLEAVDGGRLVTDPTQLSRQRVRFDRIGADSLPREASRALIGRAMEEMV